MISCCIVDYFAEYYTREQLAISKHIIACWLSRFTDLSRDPYFPPPPGMTPAKTNTTPQSTGVIRSPAPWCTLITLWRLTTYVSKFSSELGLGFPSVTWFRRRQFSELRLASLTKKICFVYICVKQFFRSRVEIEKEEKLKLFSYLFNCIYCYKMNWLEL